MWRKSNKEVYLWCQVLGLDACVVDAAALHGVNQVDHGEGGFVDGVLKSKDNKMSFSSISWMFIPFVNIFGAIKQIGWYPELVFLTVVFPNSTDLAVVIYTSTVFWNSLFPYQPYFLSKVWLNNNLYVLKTSINHWLYFVAVICWKTFYKTLLLENTRVEIVLLNNSTDGNTSSGFHPMSPLESPHSLQEAVK